MLSVLQKFAKQKARGLGPHEIPPPPHVSFAAAPSLVTKAALQAPLAQQLAELQRRSCDVLGHHLVKHPAAGGLRRLGNVLLANILRLQTLWRNEKPLGSAGDPAAAEMADLMQTSHRLLDVVVAQLALCSSTARAAVAVAEWGRRIVAYESVNFHALLPLVDRVCDDVRRSPALRAFTPISGLALQAVVESQSAGAGAAEYVAGLTTARVLAWCLGDDRRLYDHLPQLILAALFQDVGKLSIATGRAAAAQRAEQAHWIDRQHPAIGAAVFGSVRGAPVELPLMIAQHHEQLDGNGFPRSLQTGGVLADSAILATATRFAGLCLERDPSADADLDYAKTRAIRTLVLEAEWGRWRLDFARQVADRVAGERPADAPLPRSADVRPLIVATEPVGDSDRNLLLHDQELALRGVHSEPPPNQRNIAPRRVVVIRQP